MSDDTIRSGDDTMARIFKTVNQLSRDHTEQVWSGTSLVALKQEPLLERIRKAMYGDLGRTEGGKSAAAQERSVLDVTAFTIYEDITGRIEAFHRFLTGEPKRDSPEETLRAWYVIFDSNYRAGKYTDGQMTRVASQLASFVRRISGHFDQPRVMEIDGECPQFECGLSHTKTADGAIQSALFSAYRPGEKPTVKCRGCGAEWAGEETLIQLGRYLGANVDEDALREMGVIA